MFNQKLTHSVNEHHIFVKIIIYEGNKNLQRQREDQTNTYNIHKIKRNALATICATNPEIRREIMRKKLKQTIYIREASENLLCTEYVLNTIMQVIVRPWHRTA